ncbi:MAG: hypothetical protein E7564_04070 [Ruminococcaceae bacterium]|nr:hypothetical protein [Oscillospiraceae bacterium]
MNTIKIDRKNCKLVAHAGHGLETENTIAGFIAAGNRDYYAIETDMHVTKDKKFVILHNDNMLAISGVDKVVKDSTLEELQAIPIYDKYDGTFRSDLRVPEVSEYIKICKKYEKVAVLEIKAKLTDEDAENLTELFKKYEYLEKAIFISFKWDNLVRVRKFAPDCKVQFLTGGEMVFTDEFLDKVAANKFDLDIHVWTTTKEVIEKNAPKRH